MTDIERTPIKQIIRTSQPGFTENQQSTKNRHIQGGFLFGNN